MHFNVVITIFWLETVASVFNAIYEWRDMNAPELTQWYDNISVCILQQHLNLSRMDIQNIKSNYCNSSRSLIDSNGSISVGYSIYDRQCNTPWSSRPYLTRVMNGFSHPKNTVLLDSLRLIADSNSVLVFVGDSIMGQMFEALFAEILRLDSTSFKLSKSQYTATESFYKDILESGGSYGQIMVDHGTRVLTVLWIRCVLVKSESTSLQKAKWNSTVPILEDVLQHWGTGGAIILVNIGIWYRDRKVFNVEILEPLLWLNHTANVHSGNVRIGWRETTAEHYDQTPNGYFKTGAGYKNHRACVPVGTVRHVADHDYRIDWKNDDVRRLLKIHSISKLFLLPYSIITRPLHSLHVTRPIPSAGSPHLSWEGGESDCTHYCWTPMLWQPAWHAIAYLVCDRLRPSDGQYSMAVIPKWCNDVVVRS